MGVTDVIGELFPIVRGRSGVEAITRNVPVVFRCYCGVRRVLVYRTKVRCRLSGNSLQVGTKSVEFSYQNIGSRITRATLSFDYPMIERVEQDLWISEIELGQRGSFTFVPNKEYGCLLSLTCTSEVLP